MKSDYLFRDPRSRFRDPRSAFWFLAFCITATSIATLASILHHDASAQTTARFGVCQPATGFARRGETTAVIGLPAPLKAVTAIKRDSAAGLSQGSIDVPFEFGNRVSWKMFDLGGREVQGGTVNIPETGSRTIDVGYTPGLCVVVLTSADGLKVLRKTVFFGR